MAKDETLPLCVLYVPFFLDLILYFVAPFHTFTYIFIRTSGNTEVPAPGSHPSPENSSKQIPPPLRQNASRIRRKPSKSQLCRHRRHALRLTRRLCPTRTCTRLFSHALALLAVWGVWEHLEGRDFESKMVAMCPLTVAAAVVTVASAAVVTAAVVAVTP